MPYLPDIDRRKELEPSQEIHTGAELNFVICRLVDRFVAEHGLTYQTLERIDGALDLAHREFHHRIVRPYEEMKWIDNGEVFTTAYEALMHEAQGHAPVDNRL